MNEEKKDIIINEEENNEEKSFTEDIEEIEEKDEECQEEDSNKVEVHFKDEEDEPEEDEEEHKFNPFDPRSYFELGPLGVLNEYSKQYQAWYIQREDEPKNAYDLFRKYAEMKDITLKEFSKQVDASLSTIKSYSSKYDWMNRKREKENIERKEEIKSMYKENKEIYKNITKEKLNFIQDIAGLRTQKLEQHKKLIDTYTNSFEKINQIYQNILETEPINWDDYDQALSRIKEIQSLINEENEKHEKTMINLINQINELEKDLRPPFKHPHFFHHRFQDKNKTKKE